MKKDFLKRQILMACAVGVGVLALSSGNAFAEEEHPQPDNLYGAESGTVAGVEGQAVNVKETEEGEEYKYWAYITEGKPILSKDAKFTVNSGTWNDIYGGYSYIGMGDTLVTNNTVIISGSADVKGSVYGATNEGVAKNNSVIVNGGTVNNVYGAMAFNLENNSVSILGGNVTGDVIGAYGHADGWREEKNVYKNTTVTLGDKNGTGIAKIGKNLYLNATEAEDSETYMMKPEARDGGTLNVYNFGNTVGGDLIATKANINFYITANNTTDPMLSVKGAANVNDSTIHAETVNVALVKDTTIKLLQAGTLKADGAKGLNGGTLSDGFTDVNLTIKKNDDNTIVAVANEDISGGTGGSGGSTSEENRKSPAETQVVGVALVNAGSDMISSKSFGDAATAINANVAAGGSASTMAPFASVGGSSIRQESGSYVDMKSWNIGVGFAKSVENSKGTLMFGPIIEYGRGSYDSYLDNGTHGEGNSSFWGIGGMVKQTNNDGLYYEGSLRIGKVKNDYSTSDVGPAGVSYDNSATYYAMHAGVGKVVAINDANSIDYYGKLFWSHQNGSTATLSNGYVYDFEATNSVRTKLGFRYNHNMDVKNTIYAGLAWQHEFNGTANATIHNGGISSSAPAPSVKGETGILELGWKINPTDISRFEMDLGLTGYTGKQKGVGANVNFLWHF